MSTEEEYLIVDRGGAVYVGYLVHELKPPISIHVAIWCLMECPVQWGAMMDILRVLFGLVNNNGRHEALPIISCEYK